MIKLLGACLEVYTIENDKYTHTILQDPSRFAIVTEFLSGGSLFSILHEHRSTPETNMMHLGMASPGAHTGPRQLHSSGKSVARGSSVRTAGPPNGPA